MDLTLYQEQRVRVKTSNAYFDVQHVGYNSLAINMHFHEGYLEIRRKGADLKIFQFPKKSYKKECDFGIWKDAEVVFSFNPNGKDKPND